VVRSTLATDSQEEGVINILYHKFHPGRGHEGLEGEYRYSSKFFEPQR
jgi:hypothetical protein